MLVSFNPRFKASRNSNPGVLKKPDSKSDPSFGLKLLHEMPKEVPKRFNGADDIVYSLGHTLPINEKTIAELDNLYLQSKGIVKDLLELAYDKLPGHKMPVHPDSRGTSSVK